MTFAGLTADWDPVSGSGDGDLEVGAGAGACECSIEADSDGVEVTLGPLLVVSTMVLCEGPDELEDLMVEDEDGGDSTFEILKEVAGVGIGDVLELEEAAEEWPLDDDSAVEEMRDLVDVHNDFILEVLTLTKTCWTSCRPLRKWMSLLMSSSNLMRQWNDGIFQSLKTREL